MSNIIEKPNVVSEYDNTSSRTGKSYYAVLKHVFTKLSEVQDICTACTVIFTDFQNVSDAMNKLRKLLDEIRNTYRADPSKGYDEIKDAKLMQSFFDKINTLRTRIGELGEHLDNIPYPDKLESEIASWKQTKGVMDNFLGFVLRTRINVQYPDVDVGLVVQYGNTYAMWWGFTDWVKMGLGQVAGKGEMDDMTFVWKNGGLNNNYPSQFHIGYDSTQNQVLNIRSQKDNNEITKETQIVTSLQTEGRGVCNMAKPNNIVDNYIVS